MHTGGEPVRIVESGYPPIPGNTILDKRRYVRENLDHLRRVLMHEPRGHFDMYGVIPVEPDLPEADLAVLFMHNAGYSTMCGHATIALGRYAVDRGLVGRVEPETRVVIQCPCGPVTAFVEVIEGVAGRVRFHSVGAFALALDYKVKVEGYGFVRYDIGYGGAFYAVAGASQFGLDVRTSKARDLVSAASALTEAVRRELVLTHPHHEDLADLYGSILTDGVEDGRTSANICVFADSQVDRSPTGSGVTARMALRYARNQVMIGKQRTFESVVGSTMTGVVVAEETVGSLRGVVVEVAGHAYYTGTASFVVEPEDPFGEGFLVR
ncbi:MAG: proline racemase family protein [bacterium]|nr:proline racemase family protein [bacterium]MDE0289113.1 proline racemase family protein [bacterium]MDE0440386.1 proline racemase family protein [bacterium]